MVEKTQAALTFVLPDEGDEYEASKEGPDLRCAVREFRCWLTHRLEHDELSQAEFVALTDAVIHIDSALEDYGVRWLDA